MKEVYSTDCTDYASKGWPDKLACQQDGRWHVVFKNSNTGGVVFGSLADLSYHNSNGAFVKVMQVGTFLSFSGISANCGDFMFISGTGVCRLASVTGGNTNASGVITDMEGVPTSQFYYTTGTFVYGRGAPLPSPSTLFAAASVNIPMAWLIKY